MFSLRIFPGTYKSGIINVSRETFAEKHNKYKGFSTKNADALLYGIRVLKFALLIFCNAYERSESILQR